jgi:hypothetical protein
MSHFDETVVRAIKHFALHRINGVEWRIISDIEEGVLAIAAVEEAVLTRFMTLSNWPHKVVTFFVLRDLSALQRQLEARVTSGHGGKVARMMLPPGGVTGLAQRPIVNLYDLADPTTCNVFVNHVAMQEAGFWGDLQAETALLAHEHAHPLVENRTVQASRQATIAVRLSSYFPISRHANEQWLARLQEVTQALVDRLCLYAPRELFTNALVIAAGFHEALCHLDRVTVERLAMALPGRQALVAGLRAEAELTDAGRRAFLMLADLQAHGEMASEVAAFRRQGAEPCARELEWLLRTKVLPDLAPGVGRVFSALAALYSGLGEDLALPRFVQFIHSVLAVLAEELALCGVVMSSQLSTLGDEGEADSVS